MPDAFDGASVQYNDWKGTAAADDGDPQHPSLYALAGIDQTKWWIVGIDLYGYYEESGGRVLALPKDRYPNLQAAVDEPDELRVTQFDIPHQTGFAALEVFKRWNMQLTWRHLDRRLVPVDPPDAG